LAPAVVLVVLAALAGCANGGSSGAAAGKVATVEASSVASVSAQPSASARPSAAASTSAEPSSGASTASAPAPTTAAPTPRGEQTASALLDSALSAMPAQQSVHMACTSTSSAGVATESIDASVASGRNASNEGAFIVTNMLVDGIAYISTDNAGVWETEGVPQAEAEKLAAGE
jgi:cytoskeletal protein RodZ